MDSPPEEDVLRVRFEAGCAPGAPAGTALARLAKKYHRMCHVAQRGTHADFTKAYKEVMQDVSSAEVWLLASGMRARATAHAERDLAQGVGFYNDLTAEVEKKRKGARQALREGTVRVKAARSAKRRRDEIALLDAYASRRPRGPESRREIAALEEDLQRLRAEVEELEGRIGRRERQLNQLVECVNSLREDRETGEVGRQRCAGNGSESKRKKMG